MRRETFSATRGQKKDKQGGNKCVENASWVHDFHIHKLKTG